MIIGKSFAIGHLPKTAGDALHQWARALNDFDMIVDPTDGPGKHDPFVYRSSTRGKRHYCLAIRPLLEWTLSIMHEDMRHPQMVRDWGFHSPEELRNHKNAFKIPFADMHLEKMRQGVEITHWLRSGAQLFDDFISTLGGVHRVMTLDEIQRMRAITVKPSRSYAHDVKKAWTRGEREVLYRLNPQWAAIECLVYGGFW